MFDRPYIKQLAKSRMSGSSGSAIGVAFLTILLGGLGTGMPNIMLQLGKNDGYYSSVFHAYLPVFIGLGFTGLLYSILVGNVILIGGRGWFLRYWRGEYPPVADMFCGFRRYSSFVTTGLLRYVYVFLWSLLFIIPGIVMGYAYSMADYIVYENPNLPASRVLDLSKRLTYGHKADLFIFGLSFIGWGILSAFTCGILGIVYVNPYMYTAHAGIYDTLKYHALQSGALRYEDFGMVPPPPPPPVYGGYGGYQQ